jgi:activating signal cointegrator complex subunit 3
MAKMNRPCYAAILAYSPVKPVLIFVSSRRQTRLTALDIISHAAADGRRFVTGSEDVLRVAMNKVRGSVF